jgi:hypothetical protein
MNRKLPTRLRAPLRIVLGGAVVAALNLAAFGWAAGPVLLLVLVVALAAVGYYVWGGRDSDTGALVRGQVDERQAYYRLRVQALVGRVMTAAAVVAYLVAVPLRASLWPFAVALALPVLTMGIGWAVYRDRDA